LFEQLSLRPIPAQGEKIKVFFFGGQSGVAEIAHQQLNKTSQGLVSCGYYDPGFVSVEAMSSPEIIDIINAAEADFLVVALGAKKGQQWIQHNRANINVRVVSHLGAVINFVAGHVERAPLFWQRCGLEWLWRIRQEPELWRRYFFDGLAFLNLLTLSVFPLAVYDRWLKRSEAYHRSLDIQCDETIPDEISLTGSAHYGNLTALKHHFADLLQQDKRFNVTLNCSQLLYIDGAFVATLLLFQGYLNEQGRELYLCGLPRRIRRLFALNNVLNRFQVIPSDR